MSKRFGRNQKRKMRQEFQHLQTRFDEQGKKAKNLENNLISSELQLRRFAEVVDERFIGLEPQVINIRHASQRVRVERIESLGMPVIGDGSPLRMMPYYVDELGIMETRVKMGMDQMIHLRVCHPDTGEYGYAISRFTMEQAPKEYMVERIAIELAEQIMRGLTSVGVEDAAQ
ncbi:hypothetical protein [Neptuniibacter halophilus]|uniref:hypothetical protein n=1 Tax=Neptuniibacter halophilus TaxID=651666 RepID=UPI0025748E5B|nr:hypothetical protein [Neptuniibacter halophilus]